MFSAEAFTCLIIAVYLASAICGFCGICLARASLRRAGCWLALAAFFGQTFFLVMGFHKMLPGGLSIGAYLQMLAWFFLLCGLGAWWRLGQDTLLLFAAPFCLMLFLMSAPFLELAIKIPANLTTSFYALHIGSLFLSLGLFFLAFIAGLFFIFLEKKLKSRKILKGIWADLPALSLLDKINSVCVLAGFPLYTIGLIAGIFWGRPVYGAAMTGDIKEVVSLFIWFLLAILFHNRLAWGWKGRKPAILVISIFILSILSIIVVNTLLPTHHSFIRN